MDDKTTQQPEPQVLAEPEVKRESFSQRDRNRILIEAVAYAGTILAGVLGMWASAYDNSYRNLDKMGLLKEIKDKRGKSFEALSERVWKGEFLKGGNFFQEYNDIRKTYKEGVTDIFKKIAGTKKWSERDRLKLLTRAQKYGIVGVAITVVSVGIGAISSISHRHQISIQLDEVNRNKINGRESMGGSLPHPASPPVMHR